MMNDCAFCNGNKCVALSKKQCIGCHFHKTKKELEEGRKKAKKRICTLPRELQIHIHQKYYAKRSSIKQ